MSTARPLLIMRENKCDFIGESIADLQKKSLRMELVEVDLLPYPFRGMGERETPWRPSNRAARMGFTSYPL